MENLKLSNELKKKLDLLGFKQCYADKEYIDFEFSLAGQKLVGLSFAKEVGKDHLIYWFKNIITFDPGTEMWDYLSEEGVDDLIENLTLYKNWLRFFKKQLAEINESLNLEMEEA